MTDKKDSNLLVYVTVTITIAFVAIYFIFLR